MDKCAEFIVKVVKNSSLICRERKNCKKEEKNRINQILLLKLIESRVCLIEISTCYCVVPVNWKRKINFSDFNFVIKSVEST